jgi:cobalt/nickel transport system permease protein
MAAIERALLDLKRLDQLAAGESPVHRLDATAKLVATVVFIVTVVSFGRYELSAMVPFFIFPAVMIALGDLPARYLCGKVLVVCPFALAVSIFNPLFDHAIVMQLGGMHITGGWISCLSIVMRSILTVTAVLVLIAVTGLPAVCRSLQRLGMPKVFALQILFLYRYLVVLAEEGRRVSLARELRSFGGKGLGLASYAPLLGHLLLRTGARADRVHGAMLARGFSGEIPLSQTSRFGVADLLFVIGWSGFFITLRFYNGSILLGSLFSGFR